jgi:hypothetical protein
VRQRKETGREGYRPRRGLYSAHHILRYWHWGLLERNLNSMGLLYRIPARGSERLRKQAGG